MADPELVDPKVERYVFQALSDHKIGPKQIHCCQEYRIEEYIAN